MTRDDLVEFATKNGCEFAQKRDWIMGKTVWLMTEGKNIKLGDSPMNLYKRCVYIRENENHTWTAEDSKEFFVSQELSDKEMLSFIRMWINNSEGIKRFSRSEND